MIKLDAILFSENGRKISYDYSFSAGTQKFFNKNNPYYCIYDADVSQVPQSIAVIPFLSNTITIAWFAGFDIEVDEVDQDYYNALIAIKEEFKKWYPNLDLKGGLIAKKQVKNSINGTKKAMLFSGGVDAFATYLRYYEEKPDLITIHGPDIEINDVEQWNDLRNYIEEEPLLATNAKNFISSNVRDFYSYHVPLLVDNMSWWGKIQHGLALLGVTAPIAYMNKYAEIAIASSYTKDIDISWGSTPETDEKITWAGLKIKHDGYELQRQDKVDLIANFVQDTNKSLRLRVCYSELREEFNCSNCEKCFRTILGLVLAGQNPNNFGFKVDQQFYEKMFNIIGEGSSSKGMNYFWWELSQKAKIVTAPFIFEDAIFEKEQIKKIALREIDDKHVENLGKKGTKKRKIKYILRNKFAPLYNLYKRIRY
tara:strand:- start:21327 stop:22601 length:1275 start_codon:yes stop_codon:yes gene_type:complete